MAEQASSIKDLLYGLQSMKLLCSDRKSLHPAGVRFVFSVTSFGLVYNHGKLGIITYHEDLVL